MMGAQQRNYEPSVANKSVLWSSGRMWDGLIVERRKFNEIDAPKLKAGYYSLLIRLSLPTTLEKSNECCQNRINGSGNICLFPAQAPRQICAHQRHEVLVIMLSSEMIKRTAYQLGGASNLELVEHHQLRDAQLEHIGMALKAEAEAGYLSGRLYGGSLCTALLARLLIKYSGVKSVNCEHKGGMAPHSLRRVIEYINDNLGEEVRLSQLAEIAGLSQHRFAHNFKRTTGFAPHQYVIRERIKRAKLMLRETDMTVTAIAYAVGCSPSRFTFLFRRETETTPSAYRASFK